MSRETTLVNFRADVDDLKRWKEAAWQSRMTMSKFIRTALEVAAANPRKIEFKEAAQLSDEVRAAPVVAKDLLTRAKESKGVCERRLPKGAFCKECGHRHP